MEDTRALVLSLLPITKEFINTLHPITSRDIYEQNSTIFNNNGLFSTTIFGEPGSAIRLTKFAYIDLAVTVLHPKIYKELTAMSSFYKGILDGSRYATYDKDVNDFVGATKEDGSTGYAFFLKHFKELKIPMTTKSQLRAKRIELFDRYELKDMTINKYIVLPAGVRDYTVASSGKVMENEINGLYRKIITIANSAKQFSADVKDATLLNRIRVRTQVAVNNVYDYIENILDGKGGYFQNRETKRGIFNGTRNVITSTPFMVMDVTDEEAPDALTSTVGIYQYVKGIYPMFTYELRSKFLHNVFDNISTQANLVNSKTFKSETITLSEKSRSKWVTDAGMEKMINKLKYDVNKQKPIIIDGSYLFIVCTYKDHIQITNSIEKLDDGYDIKNIRPITYGELLYIVLKDLVPKYPALVTRYPITGLGSIVPTKIYLKSTTKSKSVKIKVLDDTEISIAREYPLPNEIYFSSLSIPAIYLERLGADFDGDKVSLNFLWKQDSVDEINNTLNSKQFFIGNDGKLVFSVSTDVNSVMMKLMTGGEDTPTLIKKKK